MHWTVFSLSLSLYFGALSLCSTLASPSVPAVEKQPHRMRLELRFIKPENLVSHSLRALLVLFCLFQVCFHVSSLRKGLHLATPA